MLSTPTLFIVGAGASAELGFPVGSALRDQISMLLDLKFHGTMFEGPDQDFSDFLAKWCFSKNLNHHEVWQAASTASRSLPLSGSVDSYLDSHLNHPIRSACVKLAIARVISRSENNSRLVCNNDRESSAFDFKPLSSTWYQRLWSILQTGVTPEDPQRAFTNFRIVTFNYDRNIERFLQLAYSHFFDVSLDAALTQINTLGIIHVYGSVGILEARPDTSKSYRSEGYTIDLDEASQIISTYTERVNSETTDRIGQLIWESQRIVFLGYCFGNANMDLIASAVGGREIQRQVYATTYMMSPETVEHARSRLDGLFSRGYSLANLRPDTARDFFDRYTGIF